MDQIFSPCFFFIITLLAFCKGIAGTTFAFLNKCEFTVWPGILANAGSPELRSSGFELPMGGSESFQAPPGWSGRFWARTRCNFDPNSGQGSCITGDCGSGRAECNGSGAIPPATLAEFTIGSASGSSTQDYYDVSLVDGYNIPMVVDPRNGSGSCLSTGCVADLNQLCPAELRVGNGDGCKSACDAFGRPEYCCSGAYSSPATCAPSVYSKAFKSMCPRSYSYAYDDATSTFTCSGADYTITFCPTRTSQKSSRSDTPPTDPGTTSGSGSESGSGSGYGPTIVTGGGSWFPDLYSNGWSLRAKHANVIDGQQLTLIASAASFLIFH